VPFLPLLGAARRYLRKRKGSGWKVEDQKNNGHHMYG